jgi:hypothetical protein
MENEAAVFFGGVITGALIVWITIAVHRLID